MKTTRALNCLSFSRVIGASFVTDLLQFSPIQASVLRAKLPYLDAWTNRRRAIAAAYNDGLKDSGLTLPLVPEWAEPAWHLYVVRTTGRDALQNQLTEAGVGTLIHYPIPPHRQEAYAGVMFGPEAFPIASKLAEELLSFPIGPTQTGGQTAVVIAAARSAMSKVQG